MKFLQASLALAVSSAGVPMSAAPARRWEQFAPSYVVSSIAAAQDDDLVVYAIGSDPSTGQSGAYRSTDAGETWSLLAEPLPGESAWTIGVDPRDSNHVLATTVRDVGGYSWTRLYVSRDAGVTWQQAGDFSGCGGPLVFDSESPENVYAVLGCSNSFLASEDGAETWQARGDARLWSLLVVGIYGELYSVRDDDGLIVVSVDRGVHWTPRTNPPCPFPASLTMIAIDPLGGLLATSEHRRMIFNDCPGIFRMDDRTLSWTALSDSGPLVQMLFDAGDPSRVYALFGGVFGFGASSSNDGGHTWNWLGYPAEITEIALSASGSYLYAASPQGFWRLAIFEAPPLPLRKTRVVAPR